MKEASAQKEADDRGDGTANRRRSLKKKARQIAASDGYGEASTAPHLSYLVRRVGIWWIILLAVPLLYGLIVLYHDVVGMFFPPDHHFVVQDLEKLSNTELRETLAELARVSVREQFALLGDAMGGLLNPLLSFVGLVFFVITLRQNHKALKDNAEELKLSRLEFELTRQELASSVKAQEEMEQTQKLQRFESTFFNFLGKHSELVRIIYQKKEKKDRLQKKTMSLQEGSSDREVTMRSLQMTLVKVLFLDLERQSLQRRISNLLHGQPLIAEYSAIVIELVNLVPEDCSSDRYYRLIRASIPDHLMDCMLLIAALGDREVCSGMRQAIEKGALLKGRPFSLIRGSTDEHIRILEEYSSKARGD